jgi:hypothetical protein
MPAAEVTPVLDGVPLPVASVCVPAALSVVGAGR